MDSPRAPRVTASRSIPLLLSHVWEPQSAKILLEKGASIKYVAPRSRFTPLMYALEQGSWEVAKLIIARCAQQDVCVKDDRGTTPLHQACNPERPNKTVRSGVWEQGVKCGHLHFFTCGRQPTAWHGDGDTLLDVTACWPYRCRCRSS